MVCLLTNNKGGVPQQSFTNPYRFHVTSAMRIHFNWQIIRRPIKDAKSGGGARDATSERIQLCKRSRERTAELADSDSDRSLSPSTHSLRLL